MTTFEIGFSRLRSKPFYIHFWEEGEEADDTEALFTFKEDDVKMIVKQFTDIMNLYKKANN